MASLVFNVFSFIVEQQLSRVLIMRPKSVAVAERLARECCFQTFALPSATFLATAPEELPESLCHAVASWRVVQYISQNPLSRRQELWGNSHHVAPGAAASSIASPICLLDESRSIRFEGSYRSTVLGEQPFAGIKLDVAKMRMLRWMSGVTKLDRIRGEIIRGTTKVRDKCKKVQESRLKGYVQC